MNQAITMDLIMKIVAVVVAFEGFAKAVEWVIGKLNASHDRTQKIDENALSLEEYIKKTDARLADDERKIEEGHKKAFETLSCIQKSIDESNRKTAKMIADSNKECIDLLKEHKEEYIERIEGVEDSITTMKAVYQETVAVVDLKIEALEKATNKHNQVIERTYKLEQASAVHDEQLASTKRRLDYLEQDIRVGH